MDCFCCCCTPSTCCCCTPSTCCREVYIFIRNATNIYFRPGTHVIKHQLLGTRLHIFFLFQHVEPEIREATQHEDVRENGGIESAAESTIENISLNDNATEKKAKPKRVGVRHYYAFYQL